MTRLAVIGTFYQRRDRTEMLLNRLLVESTYQPDEFWMMCEEEEDAEIAYKWEKEYPNLLIKILNTPKTENGQYKIIPYSNKINWALDRTKADYIVYLDNYSTPHVRKYEIMKQTLDNNPDWNVVYCSQNRTGYQEMLYVTDTPEGAAHYKLNYTQVMHKRTNDRWDLDMKNADPADLADALFWQALHFSLGIFYPVTPMLIEEEALDEHYIPSRKAVGI